MRCIVSLVAPLDTSDVTSGVINIVTGDARQGEGREYLREATQVKNIWIPYGE